MTSDGAVPLLVLCVTLLPGCPQASQQPLPSAPPGGRDHESRAPGARGATPVPTAGAPLAVVPGPVTPEPAVPPPPTVEAVRTSTHDFAFTPTGLLFVDIATGAMRSCTSTVPFEQLAEWARPGGALGPFVPTAATSPASTPGSSTDTLPDCPRRLPRAGTVCTPTRFEACAYERADPACEGATLATCSDGRWETECNW